MKTSRHIILFFAIIMMASVRPTQGTPIKKSLNGRKVVLMSMDGFRHDYLKRTELPNFEKLIASGVKVPYVNNTFTTLTFPCHYTIATGRYEESHGIVQNKMFDPVFNSSFNMRTKEARWWDGAEPIWLNAYKSGLKVGVFFWPGSETALDGHSPIAWRAQPYDWKVPFNHRIDTLVSDWMVGEGVDFGIIYFNEPDHHGHTYGPEAPEMVDILKRMDETLGYFMKKLEDENIAPFRDGAYTVTSILYIQDRVDFIITSDHGMTTIDQTNKLIALSDYVNGTLLKMVVGGGALAHLIPVDGKREELVDALSNIDHLTVYRKEDIPDEYHYKHHRRVLPVVVVADLGWEVRETDKTFGMKGNHGFSNKHNEMKPILIASGPSFKKGVEVDPIKNVDIYPLLCHLLNITEAPNNGSFARVEPFLGPPPSTFPTAKTDIITKPTPSVSKSTTINSPLNGRKVVLMSMDGFRHDYLKRTELPNFDKLIAGGVKVPYVNNTFTTLTFPCHYTIATGRYEESHGIVQNKMYDPVFKSSFSMKNTETRWWDGAEPIWVNAYNSGLKVGVFFWPGSEVALDGHAPAAWRAQPYDWKVPFNHRIDTLVSDWMVGEGVDFGVIYFNEPDHHGHTYGPEAPEMVDILKRMDETLGYFMKKLEDENLADKVDFIITSDHGMTSIDQQNRYIALSDYVDDTLLKMVVGGGALAHLIPVDGKREELVEALSNIDHLTVYRKEDIPDEYHYKHHRRVLPVVVVADLGWEVRENHNKWDMKGNHGFSNKHNEMKPILIASGPSFKKGVEVDPIKNVDIYPLLCHLLNITEAPNNGSFARVEPFLGPPPSPVSTNKPTVITTPSPVSTNKPTVITTPSPVSTNKPTVITTPSPVSTNKPTVITTPSPVSTNKPTGITTPSQASTFSIISPLFLVCIAFINIFVFSLNALVVS